MIHGNWSYILRKNGPEKKYTPVSEEMVIQSLFGEVKKSISIYMWTQYGQALLSSTDNNFDVLDHEIIFDDTTYLYIMWKVINGANLWNKLFSKLFYNDSGPTEILIGADFIVAGLFTGIILGISFLFWQP